MKNVLAFLILVGVSLIGCAQTTASDAEDPAQVIGRSSQESELLSAIWSEDLVGVRAAIAAGASPNVRLSGGLPVVLAAEECSPEVLALLLEEGGNPDAFKIIGVGVKID